MPPSEGKRRYGYSRDKRSDCVQVVIALIIRPEGVPLTYEVMPGNTSDKTTLADFLKRIEDHYGKSERVWVMDRGIPSEESLAHMRHSETPVYYLVGTPRDRLTALEKAFLGKPWEKARESVEVKLLEQSDELYILAKSSGRLHKERATRQRKLKRLWKRLNELQHQRLSRDQLLIKLRATKKEAGSVYALVTIHLPTDDADLKANGFGFSLRKDKLRRRRRREGRYSVVKTYVSRLQLIQ